jgi:hypothetical protein
MIPSTAAVRSGQEMVDFLKRVGFLTPTSFVEYLRLRKVERYRVAVYPGVVVFRLPESKRLVMRDVALHRPPHWVWIVEPLRWWERGCAYLDRLDTDVMG